jgi:ribonuclease-3
MFNNAQISSSTCHDEFYQLFEPDGQASIKFETLLQRMKMNNHSTNGNDRRFDQNLKKFKNQLIKSKLVNNTMKDMSINFPSQYQSVIDNDWSMIDDNVLISKPVQTSTITYLQENTETRGTETLSTSPTRSLIIKPNNEIKAYREYNSTGGIIHNTQQNNIITLFDVSNILLKYNVSVQLKDENIYRAATTHKAYQRLEFLGDSLIHAIISEYIYLRYEESEGFMTQLRIKIENNKRLAKLCKLIGLNKYIQSNNLNFIETDKKNTRKVLADIFEAFIAALMFDTNYDVCKKFLFNVMEREIDFADLLQTEKNYKTKLLEYCHRMKYCDPIYDVVSMNENKGNFCFVIKATSSSCKKQGCVSEKIISGCGHGTNKKKAQQKAAKNALRNLGMVV